MEPNERTCYVTDHVESRNTTQIQNGLCKEKKKWLVDYKSRYENFVT